MADDALPRIRVVSAEIVRNGHYLITQRMPEAVLPGLWEFPGGRVRQGETDEDALKRCLDHRTGLDIQVGRQTMEVLHTYADYELTLAVYQCTADEDAEPEALAVADVAWVQPDDFGQYEFPGADQATVDTLVTSLEG